MRHMHMCEGPRWLQWDARFLLSIHELTLHEHADSIAGPVCQSFCSSFLTTVPHVEVQCGDLMSCMRQATQQKRSTVGFC